MKIDLQLSLTAREPDRAHVLLCLDPAEEACELDGVAVELFSRRDERLSPRLMLPIQGVLSHPIEVRAELRAQQPFGLGGYVLATAWHGKEQRTACCPADMWTAFERHVQGRRPVPLPGPLPGLTRLEDAELRALSRTFTWLPTPLEPEPVDDLVDDIAEDLGLEAEDAEWLRELMSDDS